MYNEANIIEESARTLNGYLKDNFGEAYELIFVNDGSSDGCDEKLKGLALPGVRVEGYSDNRGKGSAVREGVLCSRGKYVLYTDCDLAYGVDVIKPAYDRIVADGADMLLGSRNLDASGYEGYTPLRRLMSKTYIRVIKTAAGFRYSDSQCGFKCLKGDVARKVFSECTVNGFAFDLEMLIVADNYKYKVTEMPVKIINHRQSQSKVNPVKDTFKMLSDVRKMKKQHRVKKTD